MRPHIIGNVLIVDPNAAEPRLAAKHNGPNSFHRLPTILVVPDCQIHFDPRPRSFGLPTKLVAEMLRVGPRMTVNIDNHFGTIYSFAQNHAVNVRNAEAVAAKVSSMSSSVCDKL